MNVIFTNPILRRFPKSNLRRILFTDMLTEDTLRYFDRFLDGIEEAVKRFPSGFRRCSLEALIQGSEPLFCLIRGGVSSEAKNELLDYGKMQLRREIFNGDGLRTPTDDL